MVVRCRANRSHTLPRVRLPANDMSLELTAYYFFGVTSIKGIAPPVTLGILPFHF
jgi:hypothetical protein